MFMPSSLKVAILKFFVQELISKDLWNKTTNSTSETKSFISFKMASNQLKNLLYPQSMEKHLEVVSNLRCFVTLLLVQKKHTLDFHKSTLVWCLELVVLKDWQNLLDKNLLWDTFLQGKELMEKKPNKWISVN